MGAINWLDLGLTQVRQSFQLEAWLQQAWVICLIFRLLMVIPLFRVWEGTYERKYYAFFMFSINIWLHSVSRRGCEAISHAHLKLVWMNRAFHIVKMLGNYSEGTSLIEKSGFFVFVWSFPISRKILLDNTWLNQKYLWGIGQVYFTYTYTHTYVCTCICMYTHTHTYVYMSIYTCTHGLIYSTKPVTSSFPPFVMW